MAESKDVLDRFLVEPGTAADLGGRDPGWAGLEELAAGRSLAKKKERRALLAENVRQLADAQELLWATGTHALLVILQAMDAAGKDSTIKHVMSGVNPQGCQVVAFTEPSKEELDHYFLWRYANAVPPRGRIGIFNRSYYEEVLVVRVHPDLLHRQRLAHTGGDLWKERFEDINGFERHLDRNGVKVVKFFLHLSKDAQRKRLLARLDDPKKQWKFSPADLSERDRWDDYMDAFDKALTATSTEWAPWHVIPADRKWVTRILVSAVLARTIAGLDLHHPTLSEMESEGLERARRRLLAD